MRSLLVLALLASIAQADDGEVLTPVPHRDPPVMVPPPAAARGQAIATTVVAGGFVVAAGFSYMWSQHVFSRLDTIPQLVEYADQRQAVIDDADRWHTAAYWLAAGSLVSLGIAGYMWTRTEPRFVPSVATSSHGGTVGLAGRF